MSDAKSKKTENPTLRKRVYVALEEQKGPWFVKAFHTLLMALILLNVIAVVVESEREFERHYHFLLIALELISVTVFTVEYLLRAWAAVEEPSGKFAHPVKGRLRYLVTPMAIIDLLAIFPFYIGIFASHILTQDHLLILRTLRLIRGFKLTRYSVSMDMLMAVLRNEAEMVFSALFILSIIIVLAATGIYIVEGDDQPDVFGSIPRALWWATVTLTTVGYGDAVPITPGGKAFGMLITVAGVGMAALPAGIIAAGFTSELARRKESLRTIALDTVVKYGSLTRKARKRIEKKRRHLGVSKVEAQMILREIRDEQALMQPKTATCPTCGEHFIPVPGKPSKKVTGKSG